MKRRIAQAVLIALLALLPWSAFAQTTNVNGSSFQVQNLSETQPANIVITYYNPDGTVNASENGQVPAGGSLTYFNGQGGTKAMAATAGFRGSVVISSDQPIVAIVNLLATGDAGESYSGFTTGGNSAELPLIMRGNPSAFGELIATSITVQNIGQAATDINVAYTPGEAGATGQTDSKTGLLPGASVTFSQLDKTGLGDRFVGSAKVTAGTGGSIAVAVNQESTTQLLSYTGFSAGSSSVVAPLVMANNFGNFTSLNLRNTGTATTVTVTYTPNTVTAGEPNTSQVPCATPPAKTIQMAAGASAVLIQAGFGPESAGFDPFFASCRYVGGATITSDDDGAGAGTTGQPIVAIANQVSQRNRNASAYEGFNTADAKQTSKAPLIMAENYGLLTSIQIQNVGAATNVTVTYAPNTITTTDPGAFAPCPTPTARTVAVAAGQSVTLIQSSVGPAADGFDSQFAGCRYVGSATIKGAATTDKIVTIINQTKFGVADDELFTYNGFGQ